MFKKVLIALVCSIALISSVDAKPGGGGGGGGGRSVSSFSSSSSKGSFSSPSSASSSSSKGSFSSPSSASRTTTTTTTSRTYSSRNVSPGGYYGGWGMGYGYNNGLLTGLIIGNMMHPHGSVMYTGGGAYNNNALLYPDGRVVDQSGRVVGTYINGQFTSVQNGQIVAQPVPADAGAQPVAPPQPVIINTGPSAGEAIAIAVLVAMCLFLFFVMLV